MLVTRKHLHRERDWRKTRILTIFKFKFLFISKTFLEYLLWFKVDVWRSPDVFYWHSAVDKISQKLKTWKCVSHEILTSITTVIRDTIKEDVEDNLDEELEYGTAAEINQNCYHLFVPILQLLWICYLNSRNLCRIFPGNPGLTLHWISSR